MTEAILTAAGVRKVYRSGGTEVCALQGLDLEVPDGQFLAVMGRGDGDRVRARARDPVPQAGSGPPSRFA